MKADFSKIIRDSIQITKSNKRLWVFGFVVASLGAGMNFGGGGDFGDFSKEIQKYKQENNVDIDTSDWQKTPTLINSNLLAYNAPQVLGSATSSLSSVFKSIPVSFYIVLGIVVLISVSVGFAIAFYAKAWSQSGLIHGIDRQNSGEPLSLYQMSDRGKLNAVEVIKITILPPIYLILAIILSGAVTIALLILVGNVEKFLAGIIGFILGVAIIISSIFVAASIHLGIIAINLESLKWKDGFKRGYGVFKKYFIDIFIMSIINCFAGCVSGFAVMIGLLIFGGIGVASVMGSIAVPPLLVAAGPIIFLCLLALIMLMGLVGAIMAVFKQSTWVLLYRQLTEEKNGQ